MQYFVHTTKIREHPLIKRGIQHLFIYCVVLIFKKISNSLSKFSVRVPIIESMTYSHDKIYNALFLSFSTNFELEFRAKADMFVPHENPEVYPKWHTKITNQKRYVHIFLKASAS